MRTVYRFCVILLLVPLVLAACAPAAESPTSLPEASPTSPQAQPTVAPDGPSPVQTPASEEPPSTERPLWQTLPLIDSRTGVSFTLGDFAGKTVFVEAMATWCSNCRAQMNQVRDAAARLDSTAFVFVGLSVETNISAGDLASYVDAQNFPWTFAVLTPDALIALTNEFGRSISNPPVTPHFVIRPDGTFSELAAGRIHSADDLIEELTAASGS